MVLNFEFKDLIKKTNTLYTFNIIGAMLHILLFTLTCVVSSEQYALHIIQLSLTGIFILLALTRKLFHPSDTIFYISLTVLALCIYIIGLVLASLFNNKNILPIALSTAHSGASLEGTALNEATCNGIVYTSFRPWMDCLKVQNNCETDACVAYKVDSDNYIPLQLTDGNTEPLFVLRKGTTDVFSDGLYVWWGVCIFTAITGGFHFILALSADDFAGVLEKDYNKVLEKGVSELPGNQWSFSVPYIQWINNGIQPMRWAEYSITASLMIVLVFIINGVTDIYLLAFSYIIMNLVNSFGAAIDYTNSAQIVAWFWACGVGALLWQFALLLAAYSANISPYMEANNKHLWQEYYNFIPWLNIGILVTYSGFGITNIVHQIFRFRGCCKRFKKKPKWNKECCGIWETLDIASPAKQANYMYTAEIAYIIQSYISKTLLCILVLIGSIQRL